MPNTIINNLTIEDIRRLKEQLIFTSVLPGLYGYFAIIHPVTAVKLMWAAGRYWLSLKLWYNVWTSFNANLILQSTPWRD